MSTVINVGHNGSGYATGDILRAVGGTAVSKTKYNQSINCRS